MKRSGSKILTTHVGSLPQPDGSWTNAATDEGELRKTVGDVMAKQRELGLDVINDGEYAKGGDWLSYTDDRLNGFEASVFAGTPLIAQGADRQEFADFYSYANERRTLFMLKVKAGAYLFESANVRHEHEYAIWETVKLPAGKIIIPGVVTHSTDVVEHPELVAQRIRRFTDLVGKENVIAGADCGFGGRSHPQIAWAKLASLAEGARLASVR
jgi:methionine synthase II (cobalamin-independent)